MFILPHDFQAPVLNLFAEAKWKKKNEEKFTFFEVMIQSRCSVTGTGMNGRFVGKLYYKNLPFIAIQPQA